MESFFVSGTIEKLKTRIHSLSGNEKPLWGKMNVAQMFSHCCVVFEQILGTNTQSPPRMMRWMLQCFFKKSMINEVPYKPNLPTGPAFIRDGEYDLEQERKKLIQLITEVSALGPEKISTIPSLSLGNLSANEWSNLLLKHLDHHLRQFGV